MATTGKDSRGCAGTVRAVRPGLPVSGVALLVLNYGNTFLDAGTSIANGVLVYAFEGTTFWAGGNGGLKRSNDNGVTFSDANDGLPSGVAVRGLFLAGTYAIVGTADGPYVNQLE
jgi:hypothetical protein